MHKYHQYHHRSLLLALLARFTCIMTNQFQPSTVQWDLGNFFEIQNDEDVWQASQIAPCSPESSSAKFIIESTCVESLTLFISVPENAVGLFESLLKSNNLEEVNERSEDAVGMFELFLKSNREICKREIKSFVKDWLLLSVYQPKGTKASVPWLGKYTPNVGDFAQGIYCWRGKTDPRGEMTRIPFFQQMMVNDHFEPATYNVTGDQIRLFVGNAKFVDSREWVFDSKHPWLINSTTVIDIVIEKTTSSLLHTNADTDSDSARDYGGMIAPLQASGDSFVEPSIFGQIHKTLGFLLQFAIARGTITDFPLIPHECIKDAYHMLDSKLKGCNTLINSVCRELEEMSHKFAGQDHTIGRGMLFHGPPGTGKTTLIGLLPEVLGLTLVAPPMVAASLKRGLVGETEHILYQLGKRAAYMPWQLCVLSLDEIDTLVTDRQRTESKGRGGGADTSSLNTLLSIIGGGGNVQNLLVYGATNLGPSIDAAFRRRMLNNIFFVGLMTSDARRKLIQSYTSNHYFNLPSDAEDVLVAITMNMGGSHVKAILEYIKSSVFGLSTAAHTPTISIQTCVDHTRSVCMAQDIFLGSAYLCDYFSDGEQVSKDITSEVVEFPRKQISGLDVFAHARVNNNIFLTGRILVFFRKKGTVTKIGVNANATANEIIEQRKKDNPFFPTPGFLYFEGVTNYLPKQNPHPKLVEPFDCNLESNTKRIISPRIEHILKLSVSFCVKNKVDTLQVLDLPWLQRCKVETETQALAAIADLEYSMRGYNSVMLLLDVDSLVISESLVDEETGEVETVPLWKAFLHTLLQLCRKANTMVEDDLAHSPPTLAAAAPTLTPALTRQSSLVESDSVVDSREQSVASSAPAGAIHSQAPTQQSDPWKVASFCPTQKRWVLFATSNPSFLASFRDVTDFPLTPDEHKAKYRQELLRRQQKCARCENMFTLEENDDNPCTWHTKGYYEEVTLPSPPATAASSVEGVNLASTFSATREKVPGTENPPALVQSAAELATIEAFGVTQRLSRKWACCGKLVSDLECSHRQPHVSMLQESNNNQPGNTPAYRCWKCGGVNIDGSMRACKGHEGGFTFDKTNFPPSNRSEQESLMNVLFPAHDPFPQQNVIWNCCSQLVTRSIPLCTKEHNVCCSQTVDELVKAQPKVATISQVLSEFVDRHYGAGLG